MAREGKVCYEKAILEVKFMSRSESSASSSMQRAQKRKPSGSSGKEFASQEDDAERSALLDRMHRFFEAAERDKQRRKAEWDAEFAAIKRARDEAGSEGLTFTLEEALFLAVGDDSSVPADEMSPAFWNDVRTRVVELLNLDSPDEHLAYVRKQISGASPEHDRQK